MDDLGLPLRLFESGFEPYGRKRVNNYFTLRWIDILKTALEDDDLTMLGDSQFSLILQMGDHTFPVMFAHYLFSRQLVTEKELELWWLLCGKPIRFAIQDFALATGLNCGVSAGADGDGSEKGLGRGRGASKLKTSMLIWNELFHGEDKPTVTWIMERLVRGKRYKDRLTRLRLALVVLVEGIICPTSGAMKIRPEVVSKLANIDEFVKYPWGRESFLMTVRSAKAKTPINYVQETMAIQGFTHGMVLVAIAACPSIIVKAGMGDPLEDSSLSSTEVIKRVVERKLTVNPVTAKAVDELGQAYVRSFVCSDAAGDILNQGLEDHTDPAVENLVSLILEDYPFDHNMWSGGVRADDVKQKKPVDESSDESGDEHPSGFEKEYRQHPAGFTPQPPPSTAGPSSTQPSQDQPPTGSYPYDVPTLLRRAADAYEERLTPLFEGYILSLKEYFRVEAGNIRTYVDGNTTAIRQLETRVTDGFESLREEIKGLSHQHEGSPFRGSSPYGEPAYGGDSGDGSPSHRVTPPPSPVGFSSPLHAGGKGPSIPNPSVMSTNDPLLAESHPVVDDSDTQAPVNVVESPTKSKQTELCQPAASPVHEQPLHTPPIDVTVGEGSGSVPAKPSDSSPIPEGSLDPSGGNIHDYEPLKNPSVGDEEEPEKATETNISPGLSTVVSQILSDAGIPQEFPPPSSASTQTNVGPSVSSKGDTGKSQVPGVEKVSQAPSQILSDAGIPQDFPPPSSAPTQTNVGPSVSSKGDTGKSQVPGVEKFSQAPSGGVVDSDEVEILEKSDAAEKSPRRPTKKQVSWSDASVAERVAAGARRSSKRQHTSPKRYSPSEPKVRKDGTKKTRKESETSEHNPKRAKKSGLGASSTVPPKAPLPLCVGGYNAFSPPAPSNRNAFLARLAAANSKDVLSGQDASVYSLGDLYHCTGVCSVESLDMVVQVIRGRRDSNENDARFEFLPPSFNVELLRNYPGFHAITEKGQFAFSPTLQSPFINRPRWFSQVDYVYSPILIKKTHWVGIVFDLKMWAIYVLDSNPACPSEAEVKAFITPIARMLPYLIARYCVTTAPREMQFAPMTISRLELPVLLEHPGYSGVASLLLLEMAARGPINTVSFSEEDVRVAAQNYAIAAWAAM